MGKTNFIIDHTPREVEYNTEGFKAKNKDEIGKNLTDTIQ
jgi:myosin heavy subunit